MTEHKVKVVRTTNYTGPPASPGSCECTCGVIVHGVNIVEIGAAFDAHTDIVGAPRAAVAPWRPLLHNASD